MSKIVCPECKRSLDDVIESLVRQRGRFKGQREAARRERDELCARWRELDQAVREMALALEVICSHIRPDATRLNGHETTAYQVLVKYPEHVRSRYVRELMGLNEGRIEVASEQNRP